MLSLITTGLGLLLKACGFAEWGEKMFELAKAQRTGEVIQKGKDDAATVQADKDANVIRNQVASESDDAAVADLKRYEKK